MSESAIDAAQVLADPLRRRLYEYVVDTGGEVSRADAARALGIQRTLAAFHLDRLAGAGLLDVARRKVSGREGPGSGRPAKLYRRSARQHTLQLPHRDYELAAHVLAEALERVGGETALYEAAREEGLRLGGGSSAPSPAALLRERGYEPVDGTGAARGDAPLGAGGCLRLRNCPFHTLARAYPPLACGLNLELVRGLLEGWGGEGLTARMDPAPDRCCVAVSKNKID